MHLLPRYYLLTHPYIYCQLLILTVNRWSCLMSVVLQFRTIRNSTVAINDQWLLLKPELLWLYIYIYIYTYHADILRWLFPSMKFLTQMTRSVSSKLFWFPRTPPFLFISSFLILCYLFFLSFFFFSFTRKMPTNTRIGKKLETDTTTSRFSGSPQFQESSRTRRVHCRLAIWCIVTK